MTDFDTIWAALQGAYTDPRFIPVTVGSSLIAMAAFLLFALPWTYVAHANPEALRRYRIQQRDIPVRRWLVPALRSFTVNNLVALAGTIALWPLISRSAIHLGPLPPWYSLVGQVALLIVVDDFLYYWMHRALHTPWLYKRVHQVHHRSVTPFALMGNYMHVIEFLATSTLVMLGPVLIGAHVVTLWIWLVFRQFEAADGHCGYELPWHRWLPFYEGPAYHDFHHRRFIGNYAGFFHYLDGVFRSGYAKGYEDHRRG